MTVVENLKWRKKVKLVAYVDLAFTLIGVFLLVNKGKETKAPEGGAQNVEQNVASDVSVDEVLTNNDEPTPKPTKKPAKEKVEEKAKEEGGSKAKGDKKDSADKKGRNDKKEKSDKKDKNAGAGGKPSLSLLEDVRKVATQAIEVSSVALHFWVAVQLVKSTKRDLDVNEALKLASYWKMVHILFLLGYCLLFGGMFLQHVPLKMYSAVFIGAIFHVSFVSIVIQYVNELRLHAKPSEPLWAKIVHRVNALKDRFRPKLPPIPDAEGLAEVAGNIEEIAVGIVE